MKKLSSKLFIILSIFFLISCGGVDLDNNKKDQENENPTQNEPLENNPNEEEPIDEPVEKSISLKVDYLNDGGANIPTTWNDEDDENTSRTASFKADEIDFSFDFVGKWYLSTNFRNSFDALAEITPPPAMTTGRFACSITSSASAAQIRKSASGL